MTFDALTILGLIVTIFLAAFVIRTSLRQGCGNSRIRQQ